jgi:hypothetical protein
MKRRTFLKSSLAAASVAGATQMMSTQAADKKTATEYYELRVYTLKDAAQQGPVDEYLGKALIPALNRQGVRPVGVFTEVPASTPPAPGQLQSPMMYVLAVYQSLEQFAAVNGKLAADADYQKAGATYLGVPATSPAYVRVESSLMSAIAGIPKIEVPEKRGRLFNLRIYESHSEAAGKKKIEMFNVGEIAIFRRTGLTPVFFGETIAGARMPNLTYMLTFPDDPARDAAWKKFRDDPEWVKLKAIPEYMDKNIVSRITNKLLRPTASSQI